MDYNTIQLIIDGRGVATLTLDRPEKHNALSARMILEITHAAAYLSKRGDIRVTVLAGSGKSFCAGGDLAWMRAQMSATRHDRMLEARKLAEMLQALNALPMPLLGRIHGNAYGGGVGLISVCDFTTCSKSALFALTETKLGLIPATISPYVIAKIGANNARRVFTSARVFNGASAKELGLVASITDDLDVEIEDEISAYLLTAPHAVARTKALIRNMAPQIDEAMIDKTIELLADTWEHPEAMEGIGAFFEKRKPNWVM